MHGTKWTREVSQQVRVDYSSENSSDSSANSSVTSGVLLRAAMSCSVASVQPTICNPHVPIDAVRNPALAENRAEQSDAHWDSDQ
jgi:hypothetical protein